MVSQDLYAAQVEYLQEQSNPKLKEAIRRRMNYFGMNDAAIEQLNRPENPWMRCPFTARLMALPCRNHRHLGGVSLPAIR